MYYLCPVLMFIHTCTHSVLSTIEIDVCHNGNFILGLNIFEVPANMSLCAFSSPCKV